jgi:ATP adenylyltransferase
VEHLWAPWRLSYITAPKADAPADAPGCFLCRAARAGGDDRANLVVHRTPLSAAVINRFPYNSGHLLVSPLAHKATLVDLTTDELFDLQLLMRKLIGVIERRMRADGFNVGLNLGRAAGAGVPGHLHWHIVPRWNGDQNFMAVTADTHVISQALDALYDSLAEGLVKAE